MECCKSQLAELAEFELTIGKFLRNLKGRFRVMAASNDMQHSEDTVSGHQSVIDALQASISKTESVKVAAAIKQHLDNATARWEIATGNTPS